ncbi:MAG: peptidoglycan-binding protein [Candidatus Staskawiczbacteria bacterium]|nr:peptidoglycan-binding protein [Candidatus Staskawiczbacteria bacterium]
MNIRKTIITATVALTMVAMIAPATVGALTVGDLQAQINALTAQLGTLQGSSSSGYVFTRNLTIGSSGDDVMELQKRLNSDVSTQVATFGAGSPGSETKTFGPKTKAAVVKYQAMRGISPTSGYFGSLTRASVNGGSTTTTPTPSQVPTGAGLSVMLASGNPVAGTIVDGQALAPLMALTFTNGDNAPVNVTGLMLKRIGVSADASLTNVYLFNGATRLTDGAAVSSTMVNFNNTAGLFSVPSMGSVTIWVLADVDGTSGETVGVQVVSTTAVTGNASSVKGTFPLTGGFMTIATGTLAGAEWNATTTPSSSSVDPQDEYTVFQNSVVVTTRAVNMTRISLRKTGSVTNNDLRNFKLYVDGVQVGTTQQLAADSLAQSYVTFDLTGAPKRLEAGTRVVKVLADIVGGSNSTFTMHLWNVADVTTVDTQYNANVLSDLVSNATFAKRSTGEQTVNAGTLTITKLTTSPSGNIVDASSNATLAKFELKAAGEKVKIETLYVSALVSTSAVSGLRNGMLLANGVQIGSTTTLYDPADSSFDYTTFNLGSSLIVIPGSPVILEVRADIYDTGTSDSTNSIVSGSTIQINIEGASTNNNGTGLISSTTLDVPASDTAGNTLTVKQGTLTLSKYTAYINRNAVVPVTAFKLSHFTLSNDTVEAINLNDIKVTLNYVSGSTNNLWVQYGTQVTSVKPTVTASNTWSINHSLPAGHTIDVMVFGNVDSTAQGVATSGVYITGTTSSSAVAVTAGTDADATTGQTITFTTGSITTALDGTTPLNQAVAGNQSVAAGKFKFTASNDSFTIKELRFTVAGTATTSAVINSLTLKNENGTVLKTMPYGTDFTITGLSELVAANSVKILTAEYNLATPYTDGTGTTAATVVTTGKAATLTLSYALVANSQGTESEPTASRTANYTYVYKSVPTFTAGSVSGQGTFLTSGSTTDLYKFSVKADAKGPVSLKQLKFAVTITDGGTGSSPILDRFSFFRGGTNITTSVAVIDSGATSLESTATNLTELNSSSVYVLFDTEEVIPAGSTYTYTLKATPTGFMGLSTDSDTVSTSIAQDTTPAGVSAGANATLFALNATATTGAVQTLSTTALGAGTGTGANVIWSDNSAQLHDYVYTSSSFDWFNGYLLDTFPLNAIGISYTN